MNLHEFDAYVPKDNLQLFFETMHSLQPECDHHSRYRFLYTSDVAPCYVYRIHVDDEALVLLKLKLGHIIKLHHMYTNRNLYE